MARTPLDELTLRLDAFFSGRVCQPALLAGPSFDAGRLEAAQRAANHSEILAGHLLVLTSGTTAAAPGDDKWVALSRGALLASANAVNTFLESGPFDVWVNPLPKFHVGGLGILARARLSGATLFCVPAWSAEAFVHTVIDHRATLASLVPTQLFDLVKAGVHAPRSLRAVIVGGGSMDATLKSRALQLGWPVLESYGMSETGSQIATARTPEERTLTPLQHVRITIDDSGAVVVDSRALFTAYLHVRESGSYVEDPKLDGRFHSTDIGELLPDGKLRILGRRSAFVKVMGENVDLGRLSLLAQRIAAESGASDAAVTSVLDERAGARVALAFSGPSQLATAMMDRFNTLVLPYERAVRAVALPEIPRTALGKVAEARLAEAVAQLPVTGVPDLSPDSIHPPREQSIG